MDIHTVAAAAMTTVVARTQIQTSLLAIRLAVESQRQVADLLTQSVVAPGQMEHMGTRIDTYA